MSGISAINGRRLDLLAHIRQSIGDILATPIGTRVMRREYGSALPYLVDAPLDRATVLDIIQASAGAIARWEPRVRVERLEVDTDGADAGRITVTADVRVLATGQTARLEGIVV